MKNVKRKTCQEKKWTLFGKSRKGLRKGKDREEEEEEEEEQGSVLGKCGREGVWRGGGHQQSFFLSLDDESAALRRAFCFLLSHKVPKAPIHSEPSQTKPRRATACVCAPLPPPRPPPHPRLTIYVRSSVAMEP